MSINIEDIASVDFQDIADLASERLPALHPGIFLREILQQLDISQASFARSIGVSPMRISHVIRGLRPVSADLALLFARSFKQSPEYWLNLQSAFDLSRAEPRLASQLAAIQAFT